MPCGAIHSSSDLSLPCELELLPVNLAYRALRGRPNPTKRECRTQKTIANLVTVARLSKPPSFAAKLLPESILSHQ